MMCMGEWVNFPFTQQPLLTTRVMTLRTSEEHLVECYEGPRTLKDCILSITNKISKEVTSIVGHGSSNSKRDEKHEDTQGGEKSHA